MNDKYTDECCGCGKEEPTTTKQEISLFESVEDEFKILRSMLVFQSEMLYELHSDLDKILFPIYKDGASDEEGLKQKDIDITIWRLLEILHNRIENNNDMVKKILERTKR